MRLFQRFCFAAMAAYFLWIAWPGLFFRFAFDDPMNICKYWEQSTWKLVQSNLLFFTSAYRPLGALFYLPILHFAGLNPLPYHIGIAIVLATDTYMVYLLARLLGLAAPAAGFAALLSCSHNAMISLFVCPSDLYDAFCVLFYLGALVYYIRIRQTGTFPNWRQTGVFLLLYVCCLNSKEIGVTLPGLAGTYELLFHRNWSWKRNRTVLIGCGFAAAYTLGKIFGPDSLAAQESYRPLFTFGRFISNNGHYLDEFAYRLQPWFTPPRVLTAWALAGLYAYFRKSPALKFACAFAILTPLPIAFIPQRGLYNLYLPLCGWAMLAGSLLWDTIRLISPERYLRRPGAFALRLALSAALIFFWSADRVWRGSFSLGAAARAQDATWDVLQQFRALNISLRPHSRVIFLRDPLVDWNMYMLASIYFRDHSVRFFIQRENRLPEAEIAKMDYIFDWQDGRLVLLKEPLLKAPPL